MSFSYLETKHRRLRSRPQSRVLSSCEWPPNWGLRWVRGRLNVLWNLRQRAGTNTKKLFSHSLQHRVFQPDFDEWFQALLSFKTTQITPLTATRIRGAVGYDKKFYSISPWPWLTRLQSKLKARTSVSFKANAETLFNWTLTAASSLESVVVVVRV